MSKYHGALLASVLGLVVAAPTAFAGVIIAPAGVTPSEPALISTSEVNTINQSGLTSGYVSGVTDFDTYVTSGVTAVGGFEAVYLPTTPGTLATLTYDFGTDAAIESIVVWNNTRTFTGPGIDAITDFDLFTDSDGDFGNGTTAFAGNFTMATVAGFGPAAAEVFSFASTSTQYVHFVIKGTQGGARPSINEVAFELGGTSVPEPATMLIFGAGLAGLGYMRRRGNR